MALLTWLVANELAAGVASQVVDQVIYRRLSRFFREPVDKTKRGGGRKNT